MGLDVKDQGQPEDHRSTLGEDAWTVIPRLMASRTRSERSERRVAGRHYCLPAPDEH